MTPLISIQHLSLTLGGNKIHHNINFSVDCAENIILLGPSGTGKTLILLCIIGLMRPDTGSITFEGTELTELDEDEMRLFRQKIGMLFQGAALFDSLSVFDNIAFPLREYRMHSEEKIKEIVAEKLELVNLSGIEKKVPSELSGGQKKRVGLARALATSPQVMLFDEPTTGLDPTSRDRIDNLIMNLRDELNITSLVVTHDMESAQRVGDRALLINKGHVVTDVPMSQWGNDPNLQKFSNGKWEI